MILAIVSDVRGRGGKGGCHGTAAPNIGDHEQCGAKNGVLNIFKENIKGKKWRARGDILMSRANIVFPNRNTLNNTLTLNYV